MLKELQEFSYLLLMCDICLAVSSTLSNKQSRLSDYQVHINDPDETEYSILVTRASEYKKLDEASSTIIH